MTGNSFRHGGNINRLAREAGLEPDRILDFSANINPLGPPEWFRSLISSQLSSLVHYPDPECSPLVDAIAEQYRTDTQEIVVGNGSTELLYILPQALPVTKALIAVPAYIDYARAAQLAGLPIEWHYLPEAGGFRLDPDALEARISEDELVILGQPNNPTGLTFDPQALRALAARHPGPAF
jgi:adenosylcobyric acid synthase